MMMKKTIKNSLLQSVAYGPHAAFMALRLKANFHASPVAIMTLLAKHRLHQSKNIALRAEKHFSSSNLLSLSLTSSLVLFFSEAVFLLSLISKHEMRRIGLVVADGSLLTGRQHQTHTQIW